MTTQEKKTLRIGIIGASGISQVSHIPNLISEPSAELVAICDDDPGRASVIAMRYNVSSWYVQAERMLKNEQLDGVIISTPTISHLPLCQLALESGVAVMVEKPFARNVDEARKIVEIAERTGGLLMVGMNHRFRDDTILLKEIMEQGELGELTSIRSGWLKRLGIWSRPEWFMDRTLAGGGVLMDLGVQMIDLIMYILNFPTIVEAVCGTSNKILGLDVEDNASVLIRFDDGAVLLLEVGWGNCDDKDVAMTFFSCSNGGAFLNPLRLTRRQKDKIITLHDKRLDDEVQLYRRSFSRELSHFIESVQNNTKPLSSGQDAVAVMEIISRLYESSGH